jgi:cysteine-rich repeat protein
MSKYSPLAAIDAGRARRRAAPVPFPTVRLVLTVITLLCLPATEAAANHFHKLTVQDPRFPCGQIECDGDPQIPPLEEWVAYTGDPSVVTFNGTEVQLAGDSVTSWPDMIFDFFLSADPANPRATAYFEFEVVEANFQPICDPAVDPGCCDPVLDPDTCCSPDLDPGCQNKGGSLELGFSDGVDQIYWYSAACYDGGPGCIKSTSTRSLDPNDYTAVSDPIVDITGLPDPPVNVSRVRMYYHFEDTTMTFVFLDASLGVIAPPQSWQAILTRPFQDFPFQDDDGVIDIYPWFKCQDFCTIRALDWKMLDCDTVGGNVDVAGCSGLGNGKVDPGETCDDGNTVSGDGCDANGQLEKIGWKCQEAIGRAGKSYTATRLASLQKCRDRLNTGATLFQDSTKTVAIADRTECPSERKAARRIANGRQKARRQIAAKCTDALVGALDACGETIDEIVSSDGETGCLIDTHDAAVDSLLTAQYGN